MSTMQKFDVIIGNLIQPKIVMQ